MSPYDDDYDRDGGWGDRPSVPTQAPTIPPRRQEAHRPRDAGRLAELIAHLVLVTAVFFMVIFGMVTLVDLFLA